MVFHKIPQDEAGSHPLHSLRSFSGCHTTPEQQSTGEVASTETNAGELKKQTQIPACGRKSETRNSKPETGEAGDDSSEGGKHSGELKKRTQSVARNRKSEARNSKLVPSEAEGSETGEARDDAGELKKRSQLAAAQNGTSSFAKKDYVPCSHPGGRADEANKEQLRRRPMLF